MTYKDDPKANRRQSYPMTEETSYTGLIVGGLLAFVVILGLFLAFGISTDQTRTATNPPAAPTTTGSAVPSAPGKPTRAQPAPAR